MVHLSNAAGLPVPSGRRPTKKFCQPYISFVLLKIDGIFAGGVKANREPDFQLFKDVQHFAHQAIVLLRRR
jgi:hypothetical protein